MRAAWLCATLLLLAAPVRAHEVQHSIERGKAVAVRANYADGQPVAYVEYQVFSPRDPKVPHQKGRTDRAGYAAFVPDGPGAWRVQIADAAGHGVDVVVPVDATAGSAGRAADGTSTGPSAWGFVARPAFGILLIAGLFALVVLLYRRKAPK